MTREEKLKEIALHLEWWMDYNRINRKINNLSTNDDTFIISPAAWPTHGQLKEWIKALRDSLNIPQKDKQNECC